MTLLPQSHIELSGVADLPITHDWDDDDPESAYTDEDPRLEHRIAKISRRGVVALSAGFAEWVAWRFSKQESNATILLQVIEAVWASVIDWRFLLPLGSPGRKLVWKEWRGPVRGPQCAVFKLLKDVVEIASSDQYAAPESACLSNLVLYVVEDSKPFKDWRRGTIRRLTQSFPLKREDPLGPPVPREALDLTVDFDPKKTAESLAKFLAALDPKANPYLRPPHEMTAQGFEGTPYTL